MFLILYFTLLTLFLCESFIYVPVKYDKAYFIDFTLGNSNLNLSLSQENDHIVADYFEYYNQLEKAITVIENNTKILYQDYLLEDYLSFTNEHAVKIIFEGVKYNFFSPQIEFGLFHNQSNENASVLYQLKKNNVINRMAYTFISNDNEIKQMIFGDASEALERKYKYKGKCDISNYWLCKLNKVVFNGVVFNLQRSYVTFQLNFGGIRIPEHFYNYWVNNAFLEEKDRREGYNDLFKCDKLESLPDFQFQFDNFVLNISSKYLYIKEEKDTEWCKFKFSKYIHDNNWTFGNPFLNMFTSTFNFETNEVTLYSNDNIIGELTEQNMKIIKKIIIWTVMILLLGHILNIITYKKI